MTSMTTRTITEEYDRIKELVQQPTVKLLDEPTAFLDLPTRVEITGLLERLSRTTGILVQLGCWHPVNQIGSHGGDESEFSD